MGSKIKEFVQEPDNIFYLFAILLALTIAVLDLLNVVNIELVVTMVLVVLSAVIALMLKTHRSLLQMQTELQNPVNQLFQSFSEVREELTSAMKTSDEIWLLSRTGRGWWRNYRSELENIIQKGGENRFLFVDPTNGALKMVEKTSRSEWEPTDSYAEFQKKMVSFLNWLNNTYQQRRFSLKVIDHLPAWTLIMLNPSKTRNGSIIYIEMATYHSGSGARPVFKVEPRDTEYFAKFVNEFEEMWQAATQWTV